MYSFQGVPGSSIHGILQARILEWVAISFSRVSSPSGDQTQTSCIVGRFFTIWATGKPLQSSGVCSNLCPLSWWCHLILCCPLLLFLQSFPASGSFPMSQLFISGGQSIGVSASASVLPMNIQGWFSLGWTGWISLQSKGLSRVFSNTTVQKHYFFGAQLSL